ncbi:MAG: hypothetical protein K9L56_14560 [Clostridiales bacterium]|nr:hypothetical protein [Clostridiales bacterium]
MAFVTGYTHTQALLEMCRAFGLPENKVKSFTLKAEANDFLTVSAEMYLEEDNMSDLIEIIRKYELVEKNNDK